MPSVVDQAKKVFEAELDEATAKILERWKKQVEAEGLRKKGGRGSGHFGHRGRPGKQGGSLPGKGSKASLQKIAQGDPKDPQTQAAKRVLEKREAREAAAEEGFAPLTPANTYVTLFHATHDEFVESIKEKGLLLGEEWMGRIPAVYFVETYEEALDLGMEFLHNDTKAQTWGGPANRDLAIIKFRIPRWIYENANTDNIANRDFGIKTAQMIHQKVPAGDILGAEVIFYNEKLKGNWEYEFKVVDTREIEFSKEDSVEIYQVAIIIRPEGREKGGPGSGHHGHTGLPGVWGGSRPGKGGGNGRYLSISPDTEGPESWKKFREDVKSLQPEDTLLMFHGMRYVESVIETLSGEGLDPSGEAHERGRVYGEGDKPEEGFHISPSRRIASGFGRFVFEFEVKAKQLISPPVTRWDLPGAEEADEFWSSSFPESFRASLSSSLRLAESQAFLIDKVPTSQIKRVWIYNSDTYKLEPYSVKEALKIVQGEKEYIEEKQLPIKDDDKLKLFKLRRDMFFDRTDALAEQLYTGEISIGEWQESFKEYMRQYYSSAAAIGKGGWDEMSFADWGRLGPVMKDQYQYLRGFAEYIDQNRENISLKYIKARSRLYGEGGGFGAAVIEAGTVLESLLPFLPRDGSTECLNRCHCRWENTIYKIEGQWVWVRSVWHLGEAEHCPTCVGREGFVVTNRVHERVEVPAVIGGY